MPAVADALRAKLERAFSPSRLVITDDSNRHAGHAGARPGGESHFTIEMESVALAGLSRVERQKRVHAVVAEELAGPVHALSMVLSAPAPLESSSRSPAAG